MDIPSDSLKLPNFKNNIYIKATRISWICTVFVILKIERVNRLKFKGLRFQG